MLGLRSLKLMHINNDLLNVSGSLVSSLIIAPIGGSVVISIESKNSLHSSSILRG